MDNSSLFIVTFTVLVFCSILFVLHKVEKNKSDDVGRILNWGNVRARRAGKYIEELVGVLYLRHNRRLFMQTSWLRRRKRINSEHLENCSMEMENQLRKRTLDCQPILMVD